MSLIKLNNYYIGKIEGYSIEKYVLRIVRENYGKVDKQHVKFINDETEAGIRQFEVQYFDTNIAIVSIIPSDQEGQTIINYQPIGSLKDI